MRRRLLRILLVAVLIAAAWSIGRAQSSVADFEIAIDAPEGQTHLTCLWGCDWTGQQRRGEPTNTTSFACTNSPNGQCGYSFNGRGFVRR